LKGVDFVEYFKVEYLKHSLFKPAEKISERVSKSGLIELLRDGMVSVISAERVTA
jgi:hypothetical protein